MAEQTRASTPAEATVTMVESEDDHVQQDVRTVRLKLRKPESKKKVKWGAGTVDNEHMNKKKSKCCCQYEKPRAFDESSSSSSDDECENCHGHVERKKKKKKEPPGSTNDAAQPGMPQKSMEYYSKNRQKLKKRLEENGKNTKRPTKSSVKRTRECREHQKSARQETFHPNSTLEPQPSVT